MSQYPDEFDEETAPGPSNFEFYTQKGGVNKRASWSTVEGKFTAVTAVIAYVPTPSGNPANDRNKFVTDSAGDVWFIDRTGSAVKLRDNSGSANQIFEDLGQVTGSTISPTTTLPASGVDWRINLFRSGIRMTHNKDFTIVSGDFSLAVAADDEAFTLIVIPTP